MDLGDLGHRHKRHGTQETSDLAIGARDTSESQETLDTRQRHVLDIGDLAIGARDGGSSYLDRVEAIGERAAAHIFDHVEAIGVSSHLDHVTVASVIEDGVRQCWALPGLVATGVRQHLVFSRLAFWQLVSGGTWSSVLEPGVTAPHVRRPHDMSWPFL